MAIYLKFGDKRVSIPKLQEFMVSGDVEAAKCLGRYYAKKRYSNPDLFISCISCYTYGAKKGIAECMINVSKYAAEYACVLDNDNSVLKCQCIAMANDYAFMAIMTARSENDRKHASKCMEVSQNLFYENFDLMKVYR